ncbi:MAG: hypothetical protein AABY00_04250 [Nanoarchaeota archaeon]
MAHDHKEWLRRQRARHEERDAQKSIGSVQDYSLTVSGINTSRVADAWMSRLRTNARKYAGVSVDSSAFHGEAATYYLSGPAKVVEELAAHLIPSRNYALRPRQQA